MRPPRIKRSSLRYPLDNVLGTPAMVRLIRVLVYDVNGPVGITEAAKMAGLSQPGTRKSMEVLERLGVASRVGTGRAQKFAPKEKCFHWSNVSMKNFSKNCVMRWAYQK
jgi:DNA-binding IclR family transcriptional regulator